MSRKSPQFNLLVTGHSRTGKSDYIQTLFETLKVVKLVPDDGANATINNSKVTEATFEDLANLFPNDDVSEPTPCQSGIECYPINGQSNRVTLRLIDTPGLSIPSGLNKAPKASIEALERYAGVWVQGILGYIEGQFITRLDKENMIKRNPRQRDSQVHACLYLMSPDIILANQGLSSMDVIALKGLCGRVNVIPCLAKSDLVSVRELKAIRSYLGLAFKEENISIFQFDLDEIDDSNSENSQDGGKKKEGPISPLVHEHIDRQIPFCIVNSEEYSAGTIQQMREMGIMVDSKKVLGREFIWGIIDCERADHCDNSLLKTLLFDSHIHDLKEQTEEYYEEWRTNYMNVNRRYVIVPKDLKVEE